MTTVHRGYLNRAIATFGRDSGLILLASLIQNANGFLLTLLIVRQFGLAAAGTLAVASIAVVVIAAVGTFGLPYTLAKLETSISHRNTLGIMASLLIVPLSLPFIVVFSLAFGHDSTESAVIAILAFGGTFFAQGNIISALQVLQNRAAYAVVPALANLLGLVVAAATSTTLIAFALTLALSRFAGIALIIFGLPRSAMSMREFTGHIRSSARFLTADMLSMAADQLTVLIASYLLGRADLGLLGLCRQMVTASDTPGWSHMRSAYATLVARPVEMFPHFRQRMLKLGVACASGAALLTVPLALFVYHLPILAVLGPIMLLSVPARYLVCAYDLRMRAVGAVGSANRIAAIRGVLACAILPFGIWLGGAPGAVGASVLHAIISAGLTRRVSLSD